MEKKTKRSKVKYSALDPSVNLKTRYELIADYDYLNKLSEKEKAWLNKFTKEYVNADLDNKRKSKNLHKTDRLRKDCYDRNNARNRCVLTRAKASGKAYQIQETLENQTAGVSYRRRRLEASTQAEADPHPFFVKEMALTISRDNAEDSIIALIDLKRKK